jgi:multisubunit Na+/H+ antiporter MnhB subunit
LDLTQLKLIESGVKNPVTAVLINYRGYDTFLEVSVLLLALIALWSVAPHRKHMPLRIPKTLILNSFVKMMTPLIVVCAGYFLWIGGDSPGGAFQAGSVLGGIGVLAVASSIRQPGTRLRMLMRLLLVLGLLFFVIDAVTMMVLGGEMLEYSSGHQAKIWILIVEGSATISIGLSLVMFFVGGQPEAPVEDEQQSEGVK